MRNLFHRPGIYAVAAAAAATVIAGTAAVAMTVQPVILDLLSSGRAMSRVVTVQNTFQTPLPVELRANVADFTPDGLKATETPTDDLLIFPPQAIIEPGRTQSFRVQYVGDPAIKRSKHYYVTVAQLPVKLPEGQSAVQILYNFQVIVNVGIPGLRPSIKVVGTEITTQGDGKPRAMITFENSAETYGYVAEGSLKITQVDDKGAEIFKKTLSSAEIQQQVGFGLVGPGQKRRILIPAILPQAGGKVEVEFSPTKR